MAPPFEISQWLRQIYPKPQIDPEWLEGCYSWIEGEYNLNPATQMDDIIRHVDLQLLESDLTDSMVAGTGLPQNIAELHNTAIRGPILLQIISITEIGHSAFTLQNVRQARLDRADMAGLAREEGAEEDEDEGPIPAYPRSMLRFQLSDGSTVLQAIEFRQLPDLTLGETKLGFKMLLKDVSIRRGIALLEPKCVIMKGHQTADLEALQDRDFARDLRLRLGKPDDPAQEEPEPRQAAPAPAPAPPPAGPVANQPPAPAQPRAQRAPVAPVRSPFRELPEPPVAGPSGTFHDDDEGQPRRRKLPPRQQRSPSPNPPARPADRHETHSHYFAASGSGSQSRLRNPSADIARERLFSPPRQPPVIVPDSDDEEEMWNAPSNFVGAQPGPSRRIGGVADTSPKASSSDIEFDEIFLDDAVLEQMDRVEQEELARTQATQVASTSVTVTSAGPSTTTQRTVVASTQRTVAGASHGTAVAPSQLPASSPASGSGSNSGPASSAGNRVGTRHERVDFGIVVIDDSEEDDKENVPVPTRHVRRRTARSVPASQEDVIELSD